MAGMQATFAFTGYWLTNPPGEASNTWQGKRALLKQQGWGFLVLANGRLDAEILKSQKQGISPSALGQHDAATAVAAATAEGFPSQTILFLDQEEGGRLLDEQAAYLLAWTEAVAATAFRPGVYASGQPVPDGPRPTHHHHRRHPRPRPAKPSPRHRRCSTPRTPARPPPAAPFTLNPSLPAASTT